MSTESFLFTTSDTIKLVSVRAKRFCEMPIIDLALAKLHSELPQTLPYHDFEHTVDVLDEVVMFGSTDKLDERSLYLLAVTAVFHDMGFIERGQENEVLGARDAVNAMTLDGGFSREEIDLVATMILDTAVRQTDRGLQQVPTTTLSKYLCDADVSNLGRPDFFEKAERVRVEIGSPEAQMFLRGVLVFISGHQWHTPAAQSLREAQKALNIAELNRRITASQAK